MKLSVALIYIAFFGLIAFAIFASKSLWPLFALIFTPTFKSGNNDKIDS